MTAIEQLLGFSLESLNPLKKRTPRQKKVVDSPTSTATLPTTANDGQSQEVIEMSKKPSDVLSFFPDGWYLSHFFHFIGDIPIKVIAKNAKGTEIKEKDGTTKMVWSTKLPRLRLADVDEIVKKHKAWGGKKTYDSLADGVLTYELLMELEKQKIDIDQLIDWAIKESASKLADISSKTPAKKTADPADKKARELAGVLASLAPNLSPEDLVALLKEFASDADLLEKAKKHLEEYMKTNGRVTKKTITVKDNSKDARPGDTKDIPNPKYGYIKMRDRK